MNKHFLFIDDSGSKDWDTPYAKSFIESSPVRNTQNFNFWRGNYFVLAGLHISEKAIINLNPEINKIKTEYFGNKHVEIKSVWMRNPKQRKKRYLEQYGISEYKLKEFIEKKWYRIFEKNKSAIQIQAFILDKRYYKRRDYTPLQRLIQVLFDRIELHPHRDCIIVFDQMDSQIKSITHNQGQILKISNKEIDLGSFQSKYSHFPPRFEKSKNSNFLQLADTVAYNIFRQFVDYGDFWEDNNKGTLKTYSFFERIADNFYNKNGRIAGFGIVKVPDPAKIRWGRRKK